MTREVDYVCLIERNGDLDYHISNAEFYFPHRPICK